MLAESCNDSAEGHIDLLARAERPVHLCAMNTFSLQPALRLASQASLALATLSLLSACGPPQTPQQRAAYQACRNQAEQQFSIQNRSSLFQSDSSLTPYTAQSANFAPTQNLANQFAHRQMVQACLRGATGPAPVAPQGGSGQGAPTSPGN
ncbi:MAG: hypothetical protein ACREFJ_09990 [Acetobacteraceae bacterium]